MVTKKEIKHQLNCLEYHLSEELEEKKARDEYIKDMKKEINELKRRLNLLK